MFTVIALLLAIPAADSFGTGRPRPCTGDEPPECQELSRQRHR
ncbi:hypothetical protein [Streptomyces sp. MMS24-I29]